MTSIPEFTEADLNAFVNRFLGWQLPATVCADECASNPNYQFPRCGTNLLTADEARAMFEYVLQGAEPMPQAAQAGALGTPSADEIMSKVQEFASTWAVVDGRFDDGTALERAEACKEEIRALLSLYGHAPAASALPEGYVAMPEWFAEKAMAAYNAANPDFSTLHPGNDAAESAASPLAVLRAHAEARVHHIYNGLCPEEAGLHDSRDPECPVCAALARIMPSASAAPAISLLAPDHRGMRVDYTGLLRQVRNALRQCDEKYLHEGVFQLGAHLKEMGQRWYAGDTAVVDEFLQLYCIEREARAAIARGAGDGKS